MENTYIELNWKPLPADLQELALTHCKTRDPMEHENFSPLGSKIPPEKNSFFWFDVPDQVIDWIRTNLEIPESSKIYSQVWLNTDVAYKHIDLRRKFSYNYILEDHPGITRWFDTDGNELDRICYKHSTWYKHIGSVYHHDVINVNYFRPAITIFNEEEILLGNKSFLNNLLPA